MKRKFLLSILGWLITQTSIWAQSDLQFEYLTEQDGLSQNSVLSIQQDREGFMWFGTVDGLNKYDGYSFTVFRSDPRNLTNTIQENYINDIHEDRQGRLWVGTVGLYHLIKRTGKVKGYLVDSSRFTYLNVNVSIYEDRQGILWTSVGGGINRFDPATGRFSSYPIPQLVPNPAIVEAGNGIFWVGSSIGLFQFNPKTAHFTAFPVEHASNPNPSISDLFVDANGLLWIGTEGQGLFRLDTKQSATHAVAYNPGGQINKSIARNGIIEDRCGHLWVATTDGLQRVDKTANRVTTYRADSSRPGNLSSNNILSVYQDQAGTLWVGTDHGINKGIPSQKPFHTRQVRDAVPPVRYRENRINSLLEDKSGTVWLGTASGLYQYIPHRQQINGVALPSTATGAAPFVPAKKPVTTSIYVLHEDHLGRLWVGTSTGLYLRNPTTGRFRHYPCKIPVQFLAQDPYRKLWIPGGIYTQSGTAGQAVMAVFDLQTLAYSYTEYKLDDPRGLKEMYLNGVYASRTGDIWVATQSRGISRREHRSGKFIHYEPGNNPNPKGRLNFYSVLSLYEDNQGIIWVGTRLGGLNRLDPKTGVFTYFTTHDGLPSNYIASITGDNRGNLWIGTNKGLSCFSPNTRTFRNFDSGDGLPTAGFNTGSVFNRQGKLLFGSGNGFVVFHPDSIKDNAVAPPVYITGLKVLEKPRDLPEKEIALSYNENFIGFDFVALDYDSPQKIQYAYWLENFEPAWTPPGRRRYVSYTNLPAGAYTFHVKAANADGIWNQKGDSLRLIIHPPWWQRPWAYGLYGVLVLGLLYAFRQYTVKQERLKTDFKLKQLEAQQLQQLDGLRSRFFANISHEFRTPLTLILAPLERLLTAPEEAQNYPVFGAMQRNARRLLHLVNQLLDLAKLEAGSLRLDPKPGNITLFLKTLATSFLSLAESRQITFDTQFPEPTLFANFDTDKLEKIVVNLLSNAFKFTQEGGTVTLCSYTSPEEKKDSRLVLIIQVSDSGIGIEENQLPKLFDRFFQVDSAQTDEGTGIGLALAKELVDLHGGQIRVESRAGQGTTFTVQLPLTVADEPASGPETRMNTALDNHEGATTAISAAAVIPTTPTQTSPDGHEAAAAGSAQAQKPILLVVEDNLELSDYVASHFQGGYRVLQVPNGGEGLQMAVQVIPDLVISDVMMPLMDGVELCKRLKSDERTSHIPLILLTAKADEESKVEGLQTGADDYLTKPFSGVELQVRVKNLIEGRKRLRERFSRQLILQPADVAITSADEKFLQRVRAVVEQYLDQAEFSLDAFEKEVGLSHVQFYRKLKALTDQAPGEFLRNYRLQKAAMLLKAGHGNVSEIAYAVGFNSLAYFTRCFKAYYGHSPSAYLSALPDAEQSPED